jgi:HEAT repeat protein
MQKLFFIMLCVTFLLYGCGEEQQLREFESNTEPENMYSMRDRAIDIVRKGLTDQSDLIKSYAIEVVATTGRGELIPMVTPLLKSDSVSVRFTAAIAIGDTKYSPGEFAVRRLLNDKDENTKIAAAYAMTKLGNRDFDSLIENALMSKDQTVRANAALLLGKLGDKKNVELLYSTLRDSNSSDRVKFQAVEAIAMLGDEEIYQKKLWALLISKYADDRIIGIRAMGALGTENAKNAIVTMLSDEVPEVRLWAARQLGRLGDPTGQVEVLEYFKEISPGFDSIRRNEANVLAAMAIGQIGTEELVKYLPRLLKSRSKKVQLSASQAVLLLIR